MSTPPLKYRMGSAVPWKAMIGHRPGRVAGRLELQTRHRPDGGEPVGHGAGQLGGHDRAVGEARGVHPRGVDALGRLHLVEEGGHELQVGIGHGVVGGVPVERIAGAAGGDHDEAVLLTEGPEPRGEGLEQGAPRPRRGSRGPAGGARSTVRGATAGGRARGGRVRRREQVPAGSAPDHEALKLVGDRRAPLGQGAARRGDRSALACRDRCRAPAADVGAGEALEDTVKPTPMPRRSAQHRRDQHPPSSPVSPQARRRANHTPFRWARDDPSPWSDRLLCGLVRGRTDAAGCSSGSVEQPATPGAATVDPTGGRIVTLRAWTDSRYGPCTRPADGSWPAITAVRFVIGLGRLLHRLGPGDGLDVQHRQAQGQARHGWRWAALLAIRYRLGLLALIDGDPWPGR